MDAHQIAIWRCQPGRGDDHAFASRKRSDVLGDGLATAASRLLGSIGSIRDALENATAVSSSAPSSSLLLDRHRWSSRKELALAIFSYIEAF